MSELRQSSFIYETQAQSVRTIVADEIMTARHLVETLGAELCQDPELTARHGESLQQLDLAAQLIEQAARLLRVEGDDFTKALGGVTLEGMRKRIMSALAIADHQEPIDDTRDDEFW